MSNIKKQKNYIYLGLGFPVQLREAEFKKINGRWLLKADVKKIAAQVIKALPSKTAGLTGAEIRFARTYFDFSKRKFADELNVSHTAVNKWEETDQQRAKIDPHVEITLRAFIRLKLNLETDFSSFFRGLMDDSKNFSDLTVNSPLDIAI
jgi:DNA-binding transcriptional regulator YiaG